MISWTCKSAVRAVAVLALGAALAACGSTPPYVYNPAEFDRENPNFAKPPKDIGEVSVCYAKWSTTPSAVADVAAKECAKYGKISRYREDSLALCPARTPTAAIFDCLAPGDGGRPAAAGRRRDTGRTATATPAAPVPVPEEPRPLGMLLGRAQGAGQK